MFSLSLGNSSSNYFDYTTSRIIKGEIMFSRITIVRYSSALLIILTAFALSACAALNPVDANGPRANLPAYPIDVADTGARLEEASVAWYQMSQRYGLTGTTDANLNPYTGTVQSLPANAGPVALPKVGTEAQQTEEQNRESLRRFIAEWHQLIGAAPNELSLVERVDEPSGIKVARYEQRPFRYPLRGGFGNLLIRFRPDRQLVSLSSTCIPNVDRLQAALNGLTPKISSDDAVAHVKAKGVVTAQTNGRQETLTIPANAGLAARQLVVYAQPSSDQNKGLQLYLAWEVEVSNGPLKVVYFDAISDQVIAVA